MKKLLPLLLLLGCPSGDPGDPDPSCTTDAEQFADAVAPILATDCISCHTVTGDARESRHLLVAFDGDGMEANHAALQALIRDTDDFADLFLDMPTGRAVHPGGKRFDALDPQYAALHEFVARTREPGNCMRPGEPPMQCEPGVVHTGPSPMRRLTDAQYRNAVRDLLGVDVAEGLFPPTAASDDFSTWVAVNSTSAAGVESMMLAAEHVAGEFDVQAALGCGDTDLAACAPDALPGLAASLFRRPLSDAERDGVRRFLDAGLAADDAVRMGVEMLLQSPQFLYQDLFEAADGVQPVDGHGVAARLALFLWNTTPDAALLQAAEDGLLATREGVAEVARTMVEDPRSVHAVRRFHRDWLRVHRLDGAQRDSELYPDWSADVVDSMLTSLDLFTTEILWQGDARFATLLTSDWAWIDTELAAVYGVPDPGEGFHRVQLEDRPGVLTRGAFLAAHAHTAASAPVQRGAFVLEDLLCEVLNPPQDVDMDLPDPKTEATTIRERLQQHWTDPGCAGCHTRMDPLGFAFEHFGAVGERREVWENGVDIDATGSLDDPAVTFDGATTLVEALAPSEKAMGCYAERWFEYALGRPADDADACTLRTLEERFVASEGDIRQLLVDIAVSDAFRHRSTP